MNRRIAFSLRPVVGIMVAVAVLAACGDRAGTPATNPASRLPSGAPPANTAAPTAMTPAVSGGTASSDSPATAASTAAAGAAASVAAADRSFLTLAASSGRTEVEASRLALERSKNSQVRNFAQKMVDDHTRANESLQALAKSAGMADVSSSMTATHSAHLERLRALDGPAFDREYAAQVGVAGHTEAVAVFERAAQDVASQDLKSFADKTLPSLRDHLKQAQALAKAVGVPADRMKAASAPPDLATSSTMGSSGTGGAVGGATSSMGAAATTGSASAGGGAGPSGTAGAAPGSSGSGTGVAPATSPTKSSSSE